MRSFPRSRFNPQFNREALAAALQAAGIGYVFLGDTLGGKRDDPAERDFGRRAEMPSFQDGLARVREGAVRHRIALMCAEKEPLDCHRFVLVCRHLRRDLAITHILADGTLEPQDATEDRLLAASGLTPDAAGGLLGESRDAALDLAYDQRAAVMTGQRPGRGRRPLAGPDPE